MTVAMPAAAMRVPATARTTEVAERSTATSRSAASGATRDALSAGVMLATSVVTTPTAAAMTIVSTPRTSPAVGRSRPAPPIRASSPVARPSPTPMPIAEATIPMASASPVTDVRICRREAPIARSSADSRVRWATRIENVLWMLNVATIEGDAGERQQDDLEEAEEVALDVGLLLGGQLVLASAPRSAPASAAAISSRRRLGADAVLGGDEHGGDAVGPVGQQVAGRRRA